MVSTDLKQSGLNLKRRSNQDEDDEQDNKNDDDYDGHQDNVRMAVEIRGKKLEDEDGRQRRRSAAGSMQRQHSRRDQDEGAEMGATTNVASSCQSASSEIALASRRQFEPAAKDRQGEQAGAVESGPSARNSNWISGQAKVSPTSPTSGQVSTNPAELAHSSLVHDKSMAQARYLYSTLTSTTGALVAAAISSTAVSSSTSTGGGGGSQLHKKVMVEADTQTAKSSQTSNSEAANKTATSKSPTRSVGLQRKQAQFVARIVERQQMQSIAASSTTGTGFRLPGQSLVGTGAANLAGTSAPSKSAGRDEPSDSSDSEPDNHRQDEDKLGLGDEPEQRQRRKRPDELDDSQQADDEAGDLVETPAIVELACEQRRRSSQTSRSVSIDTTSQQQQQQQQLQQLQPVMDPEMHALWAQGADLDTGNGNFIQATRRRRSVHAIHQVQLHQQLVSGNINLGTSGQGAKQISASAAQRRLKQSRPDSSPGSVSSTTTTSGSGPAPVVGLAPSDSRNFKDKLRKLRSSKSIEESNHHHLPPKSRARFVSDPVTGRLTDRELNEGDECERASSSRKSEPLIGSKLDEMADEEDKERVHSSSSMSQHERSFAPPQTALQALEANQELAKRNRLDTEQTDYVEEMELDPELALVRSDDDDNEDKGAQHEDSSDDTRRVYFVRDAEYDLDELESSSSMLAGLFQWNYPIFELAERYGQSILSKLSYRIFFDSGFFDSFKIPKQAFLSFFNALEEGYLNKPYHNRLHAADVLHAVYYLTSQPIDHFCQVPLDLIELYDNLLATTKPPGESADSDQDDNCNNDADGGALNRADFMSKLHNHIVAIVVAAAAAAADSELPFGIMGANLTALEVMALYTAAAMHDFQHPGRTNSFLVATSSPLALLYNDRSVLENHHSAAAWALFYSNSNLNWLCNLEKDEFKRFRFMIIELILATDLMRHYELVSAFNKKVSFELVQVMLMIDS